MLVFLYPQIVKQAKIDINNKVNEKPKIQHLSSKVSSVLDVLPSDRIAENCATNLLLMKSTKSTKKVMREIHLSAASSSQDQGGDASGLMVLSSVVDGMGNSLQYGQMTSLTVEAEQKSSAAQAELASISYKPTTVEAQVVDSMITSDTVEIEKVADVKKVQLAGSEKKTTAVETELANSENQSEIIELIDSENRPLDHQLDGVESKQPIALDMQLGDLGEQTTDVPVSQEIEDAVVLVLQNEENMDSNMTEVIAEGFFPVEENISMIKKEFGETVEELAQNMESQNSDSNVVKQACEYVNQLCMKIYELNIYMP